MKRMALTLMTAAILAPAIAMACSCVEPPPPRDALKEATAVFTGRVTSVEIPEGTNGRHYEIEVYAVWKGPVEKVLDLYTDDPSMCGIWMEVDDEALIYAYGEPGSLETSNCSRSTSLDLAGSDLEALGTPLIVPATGRSVGSVKSTYAPAPGPGLD